MNKNLPHTTIAADKLNVSNTTTVSAISSVLESTNNITTKMSRNSDDITTLVSILCGDDFSKVIKISISGIDQELIIGILEKITLDDLKIKELIFNIDKNDKSYDCLQTMLFLIDRLNNINILKECLKGVNCPTIKAFLEDKIKSIPNSVLFIMEE